MSWPNEMAHLRLLAPLRPRQGQADPGRGEDEQRLLDRAAGRGCADRVSSSTNSGAASRASCLCRAQAE